MLGVAECSPYDQISKCQKKGDFSASDRVRSRHEVSVVPMPSVFSALTSGALVKGAVSRRNSAKLGNYKIIVKLRET